MPEIPPLLRYTLDQLQDAVILVDANGQIVFYNAAAEQLTGVSTAEAAGRDCRHVFGSENDQAYCVFEEFAREDLPRAGSRAVIRRKGGGEVPVDICMARVPEDVAGEVLMVGMIRDVSVLETLAASDRERNRFGNILARSPKMQEVFALIETISDTSVNVLIQGESGTGKELVARAIHEHSPHKDGPFHAVNCGALTVELLDSEIFGHEKGSFTGAIKDKPGRIELAAGGTLFLDEVGDMPQALQVKLLRVLQEREFERVGGTRTLTMDARILAATNQDLQKAVREGRFRKDLYFRLNVVPVRLPPLRERPGDVELIAEYYLRRFAGKSSRPARRFAGETMRILMDYHWPGNVRELVNAVEYMVAVAPGDLILPQDMPEQFRVPLRWSTEEPEIASIVDNVVARQRDADGEEKRAILDALAANRYRREQTAKALNMSRTTLWRKMREYGIR